jgi:hypothetical protein
MKAMGGMQVVKQSHEPEPDQELVDIVRQCRESTPGSHFAHPEITAALINYRAAQLVSGWLAAIAEHLSNIEVNIRNR